MDIWLLIILAIGFVLAIPLVTAMLCLVPCLPGLLLALTSSQPKKSLSRRIAFGLYFVLLLLAIVFPGLRIDYRSNGEDISAGAYFVKFTFFGGSISQLADDLTKKDVWRTEDSIDTSILACRIVMLLLFPFLWGIMSGWANEDFCNFLIRRGWKKSQPVAQGD